MPDRFSTKWKRSSLGSRLFFVFVVLLFLCHLPHLLEYAKGLWSREHYQFFPLALACMLYLFKERRAETTEWRWYALTLILGDIALLGAGIYLNGPWLVYAGFLCLVLSVGLATPDKHYQASLGGLALLGLTALRLPVGMDEVLINKLQTITTIAASNILHTLQVLHLREGNIIEVVGKQFLVEEACSGVQSLFAITFLAALIACVQRRRLFQVVALLASAVVFAGVMNFMRVTSVAISWTSFGLDLSEGWRHEALGYVCLVVAALLVWSMDCAIGFLSHKVPDSPGRESGSPKRWNPISFVWNFCFHTPKRADGPIQLPSFTTEGQTFARRFGREFQANRIMRWFIGFPASWFLSRPYRQLTLGIPAIIIVVVSSIWLGFRREASQTKMVDVYEKAFSDAIAQGNEEKADLCIRSLIAWRPNDNQFRFNYALRLEEQGGFQNALQIIEEMAESGPNEYGPAHKWLVSKAIGRPPAISMTDAEIEQHAVAAARLMPNDLAVSELLVQILVRSGKSFTAEEILQKCANREKKYCLALARLQADIGREQREVQGNLQKAKAYFSRTVQVAPEDIESRLGWAETLMLLGELETGRNILEEGLIQLPDNQRLQTGLSQYLVAVAREKFQQSPQFVVECTEYVERAIALDPANSGALIERLRYVDFGKPVSTDVFKSSIQLLQEAESKTEQQSVLLANLLAATSEFPAAIKQLENAETLNAKLRQLELKAKVGSTDVYPLATELLKVAKNEKASPALVAQIQKYVDPASAQQSLAEALDSDQLTTEERTNCFGIHQTLALSALKKAMDNSDVNLDEVEQHLDQLFAYGVSLQGVEYAVQLTANEDSKIVTLAQNALNQLIVRGVASFEIYRIVGNDAFRRDNWDLAIKSYERALNISPENPVLMNNLSLALIRSNSSESERALDLVNRALETLNRHPDILATRGEVYLQSGQPELARADFEASMTQCSNPVKCRELLANTYDVLGETELAAAQRAFLARLKKEGQ